MAYSLFFHANQTNDVTLMTSSGANNNKSDYVESCEDLTARSDNSTELSTIIEEIVQMHEDINTALREFSTP